MGSGPTERVGNFLATFVTNSHCCNEASYIVSYAIISIVFFYARLLLVYVCLIAERACRWFRDPDYWRGDVDYSLSPTHAPLTATASFAGLFKGGARCALAREKWGGTFWSQVVDAEPTGLPSSPGSSPLPLTERNFAPLIECREQESGSGQRHVLLRVGYRMGEPMSVHPACDGLVLLGEKVRYLLAQVLAYTTESGGNNINIIGVVSLLNQLAYYDRNMSGSNTTAHKEFGPATYSNYPKGLFSHVIGDEPAVHAGLSRCGLLLHPESDGTVRTSVCGSRGAAGLMACCPEFALGTSGGTAGEERPPNERLALYAAYVYFRTGLAPGYDAMYDRHRRAVGLYLGREGLLEVCEGGSEAGRLRLFFPYAIGGRASRTSTISDVLTILMAPHMLETIALLPLSLTLGCPLLVIAILGVSAPVTVWEAAILEPAKRHFSSSIVSLSLVVSLYCFYSKLLGTMSLSFGLFSLARPETELLVSYGGWGGWIAINIYSLLTIMPYAGDYEKMFQTQHVKGRTAVVQDPLAQGRWIQPDKIWTILGRCIEAANIPDLAAPALLLSDTLVGPPLAVIVSHLQVDWLPIIVIDWLRQAGKKLVIGSGPSGRGRFLPAACSLGMKAIRAGVTTYTITLKLYCVLLLSLVALLAATARWPPYGASRVIGILRAQLRLGCAREGGNGEESRWDEDGTQDVQARGSEGRMRRKTGREEAEEEKGGAAAEEAEGRQLSEVASPLHPNCSKEHDPRRIRCNASPSLPCPAGPGLDTTPNPMPATPTHQVGCENASTDRGPIGHGDRELRFRSVNNTSIGSCGRLDEPRSLASGLVRSLERAGPLTADPSVLLGGSIKG